MRTVTSERKVSIYAFRRARSPVRAAWRRCARQAACRCLVPFPSGTVRQARRGLFRASALRSCFLFHHVPCRPGFRPGREQPRESWVAKGPCWGLTASSAHTAGPPVLPATPLLLKHPQTWTLPHGLSHAFHQAALRSQLLSTGPVTAAGSRVRSMLAGLFLVLAEGRAGVEWAPQHTGAERPRGTLSPRPGSSWSSVLADEQQSRQGKERICPSALRGSDSFLYKLILFRKKPV